MCCSSHMKYFEFHPSLSLAADQAPTMLRISMNFLTNGHRQVPSTGVTAGQEKEGARSDDYLMIVNLDRWLLPSLDTIPCCYAIVV